jgi:hypothetical protein
MRKIYQKIEKQAEKINKGKIFRLARNGVIGSILYIALLGAAGYFIQRNSPPLRSRQQIESIVEREREHFGIDSSAKINVRLEDGLESYSRKSGKSEYDIVLNPSSQRESTLTHELAHIGYGDCDSRTQHPSLRNGFSYFLWQEPRAILHTWRSRNKEQNEMKGGFVE